MPANVSNITFPWLLPSTNLSPTYAGAGAAAIADVTTLRAIPAPSNGVGVLLAGRVQSGDGLGGIYVYSSTSTATDDGVNVIRPAGVLVGAWLIASTPAPTTLSSVANVQSFVTTLGTAVLKGYATDGDGGGGTFIWSPTSTADADGGTVFNVDGRADAGRLLRVFDNATYAAAWFGVRADGVTNDTLALQAAINAATGVLVLPNGTIRLASGVVVSQPMRIVGSGQTVVLTDSSSTGTVRVFDFTVGGSSIEDVDFTASETRYEGTRYLVFAAGTSVSNRLNGLKVLRCRMRDIMTGGFVALAYYEHGFFSASVNTATGLFTANGHTFVDGQTIGMRVTANGTFPFASDGGEQMSTRSDLFFFVRDSSPGTTFKLTRTSGGAAIGWSSAGSGFQVGDNLLMGHGVTAHYVSNLEVSGCSFNDLSGFGVSLVGCDSSIVSGCSFDDTGWASCNLYAGNTHTTVSNNTFTGTLVGRRDEGGAIDCPSNSSGGDGPNIGLSITGNRISGYITYGDGIRLGSCQEVLIDGNVIDRIYGSLPSAPGACISLSTRYLPTVQPPCKNVTITNNKMICAANSLQPSIGMAGIYSNAHAGWAAFTTNAGTETFTTVSPHGFASGLPLVVRNRGGALPTGLTAATTYYVINPTSTTFQLALTVGGAIVAVSDVGSGTSEVCGALAEAADGLVVSGNEISSPSATEAFTGGVWVHAGDMGQKNVFVTNNSITAHCRPTAILPAMVTTIGTNASGLVSNVHVKGNTCVSIGAGDAASQLGVFLGDNSDNVYELGNIADTCTTPYSLGAAATRINKFETAAGSTGGIVSPNTFTVTIGTNLVGRFDLASGEFQANLLRCYGASAFGGDLSTTGSYYGLDFVGRDVYLPDTKGLYLGGSSVRTLSSDTGVIVLATNGSGITVKNQNRVATVLQISEAGAVRVQNKATIYSGTGSPQSVVTGSVGDIFLRTDGGASTCLYVKESGAATNTGWTAK